MRVGKSAIRQLFIIPCRLPPLLPEGGAAAGTAGSLGNANLRPSQASLARLSALAPQRRTTHRGAGAGCICWTTPLAEQLRLSVAAVVLVFANASIVRAS